MSRLSREQKRELKRRRAEQGAVPEEHPAAGVTPIEVRVPAEAGGSAPPGGGVTPGGGVMPGGGATVDGVPVVAAPGESVQDAVLNHLHRLALAGGRPVMAAIHDERTGFVVPIQVYGDGSSTHVGEPYRIEPQPYAYPQPQAQPYPQPEPQPYPRPQSQSQSQSQSQPREPETRQAQQPSAPPPPPPLLPPPVSPMPPAAPVWPPAAADPVWPPAPADPVWPPAPTDPAPTDPAPNDPAPSTFALRARPEPEREPYPEPDGGAPSGVAVPPTGEFGPAPGQTPARQVPMSLVNLALDPEPEPAPKPAPPRGFDTVAEAVLAPVPELADEEAFLAEPLTRINEAVQEGRIEEAAGLAERAVTEAVQTLGSEHPEVLRLRELLAYIAYLAGDAIRSFRLSLDLARTHRRHRDLDAAYGNVQSAATAWRAVRDPSQGLDLGRDLIGVWTELTADGGPAADDIEQLDKANTRMDRLTERARGR